MEQREGNTKQNEAKQMCFLGLHPNAGSGVYSSNTRFHSYLTTNELIYDRMNTLFNILMLLICLDKRGFVEFSLYYYSFKMQVI